MKLKHMLAGMTAFSLLFTSGIHANAESLPDWQYDTNAWAILNVKEHMGETYLLLDEDREKLESVLKNTEKYGYERSGGTFHGACHGFAVTSVLSAYGLIPYEEYALNDEVIPTRLSDIGLPYICDTAQAMDVTVPDNVKSLINYCQKLQLTDVQRQLCAWQMYAYTEEERVQELLRLMEEGIPAVVGLFYFTDTDKENARAGHAVVAYAVEDCDFDWDYKHYDKKICLYDSNGSLKLAGDDLKDGLQRLDQIYVNTEDYSWVLPIYHASSADGATMTYNADVNLLNEGGILSGTEAYTTDNPFIGVMTTNWLEGNYTIQKAESADGTLTATGNAYFKLTDNFYPDCIESARLNFLTEDAEDAYILELEAPQELEAFMYYEDSIQRVQADSISRAAVSPDGFSEMTGDNTAYTFEMVWNEGYYTGSWYDFTVSGTADTASLQKTEDGYLLKSDNLQNVTAAAGNDETQATLTFSTNADSVLLCEVNESTLAAKIDTDGDGTYETELFAEPGTSVYGDFNADGEVNAVDAALILEYAAYAGAGGELSFENFLKNQP